MIDQPPNTHEFAVNITWTGGKDGSIAIEDKLSLPLSSPIYWNGTPDAYSPHDLFISAVTGCYLTTFASMMKKVRQQLEAFQISGRGVLEKHPDGGWHFTHIHIIMEITVPKDAKLPQIKRALDLTEKYCHISRSIKCKVLLEPKITKQD
ncbi:MAG: OsmC family protein [Candidatus Thorarchaeota archaeon]